MDTLRALGQAGLDVKQLEPERSGVGRAVPDAIFLVATGSTTARFAVEVKQRAPYPNELLRLDARRDLLSRDGQPLIVVPFVSESLGPVLADAGWSCADAQGNFDLRAPGLMLRQRRTTSPPKTKRNHLPQGSGSLAIIRALIRFGSGEEEEARATTLAAQAKVSQPRASQVLAQLHDLNLVERSARGRWVPRRAALLDRFLAEYNGPGGSERYLYSLEAPSEVAIRAAHAQSRTHPTLVSADVGPDLLMPWRRPSVVILYATHEIDLETLALVEAQGPQDANVIVRNPDDRSVFPVPQLVAEIRGVEIPLADPAQLIWDLQNLGGADRLEGAGRLREWLLALQ